MESSVQLDDLPLELLITIFSELPARQIIDLCQLSRYLNTINHDWKFWRDKACRDFNYPPTIFDQTSIEHPVQRYYQITKYQGPLKQAMVMAIRYDNVADLKHMSDQDPHPVTSGYRKSHLSVALARGHLPMIEYVLNETINLRSWTYRYESLKQDIVDSSLVLAAEHGHLHVIEYLIKLGVTKIDPPLRAAAKNGHVSIVAYLLKRPTFKMWMAIDALNAAAKHQHWTTVEFLLDQDPDITQVINVAANTSNMDLIQYLIDHREGIDLNPCLHVAAKRGDLNLVKFFLNNGANDIVGALNVTKSLQSTNHGNRQYVVEEYLTLQLNSSRR
jgi:hypothetical protein